MINIVFYHHNHRHLQLLLTQLWADQYKSLFLAGYHLVYWGQRLSFPSSCHPILPVFFFTRKEWRQKVLNGLKDVKSIFSLSIIFLSSYKKIISSKKYKKLRDKQTNLALMLSNCFLDFFEKFIEAFFDFCPETSRLIAFSTLMCIDRARAFTTVVVIQSSLKKSIINE